MATVIASHIENIMNETKTLLLFYTDSLYLKKQQLKSSFSDFLPFKDNLESGYTVDTSICSPLTHENIHLVIYMFI